jgi:hypothetical protein
LSPVLLHALRWGLWISLWLTLTFALLMLVSREMWLNDYPPDIRARFGPMSARANRLRWLLGVPVLAVALGIVVQATLHLLRTEPAAGRFGPVFLHTFVMLSVFNLIDLLFLDWLLFVKVKPRFVVLPGTEGMAGYDDYAFHGYAFLKGTAGILVFSLILAGIVPLFT